jgi:hypothetical protein
MLGLCWNELSTPVFPVKRGSTLMPMLKCFVHKAFIRRTESEVYESEQFLYVGGQTGVCTLEECLTPHSCLSFKESSISIKKHSIFAL